MIVSVHGKIDNSSVVFSQDNTGKWICTVPFDKDGYYIVELYATDEAGNESYYADALFIVNLQTLELDFKILDYNVGLSHNKYKLQYYSSNFNTETCCCNNYQIKCIC